MYSCVFLEYFRLHKTYNYKNSPVRKQLAPLNRKGGFMKVGIVGRPKDTFRYEQFLSSLNITYTTSLSIGNLSSCQALLFPGGGDITPELFGQSNHGSRNIDTELDILQLRAFQYGLHSNLPILGICKGMQLINVALGGTLIQDLSTASLHTAASCDLYHETVISSNSYLHTLYGNNIITNSRHHQGIDKLGENLIAVQHCPLDQCIEAIEHTKYPVWGVQWHPERLSPDSTSVSGIPLFLHFLSFA